MFLSLLIYTNFVFRQFRKYLYWFIHSKFYILQVYQISQLVYANQIMFVSCNFLNISIGLCIWNSVFFKYHKYLYTYQIIYSSRFQHLSCLKYILYSAIFHWSLLIKYARFCILNDSQISLLVHIHTKPCIMQGFQVSLLVYIDQWRFAMTYARC